MDRLVITGGNRLYGRVKVSPAKNAVLPVIAATLLAKTPCFLEEVPALADVETICSVIEYLGARVKKEGQGLKIHVPEIGQTEAPYDFVRRMRASFLVMGPLLARSGRARIALPGGCAIGSRPIDLHLKGFCLLGAEIIQGHGYIEARAKKLSGSRIYLDFPSVGATENLIMAASMARGRTVIENAAEEPEVVDLANFLNAMGARVKGAGTKVVRIDGVDELRGAIYNVIPDRIEAGTFMIAAAISGGDITVENVICDHITPVLAKLQEAGVYVERGETTARVAAPDIIRPADIKTMPYPGFPTDMQPQFMTLMSVSKGGASIITETVFENRFMHVNELKRMGAKVKVIGRTAIVQGVKHLTGARVKAPDLRAGAALVLAGLAARGETEVSNIYHIDRGYESFVDKIKSLGAGINRIEDA
ncbi:UDP-N-acetylglucosamine 1-carboxyvinyltransferase [Desulfocucumis palustris]|uniref:UDP-N-acetylglucosamine 1-carboxyvinyltransferase n=1 Tax=Desulfocucumis palustris TaxID=1898651 RepID=A0A2L2XNT2_9FIRM|nr:UDP-N-acetylglucosamine 1-carboxyvinyltransferase [Desulfocucumis palustris]GBF35631.1 UDP-N-acetylglucosamine 1-carboxyvinyltransferase [Desulfocucumis palustris]